MVALLPKLIAVAVWSIVGLLMWIPILSRAVAVQAFLTFLAAFDQGIDTSRADSMASAAWQFYARGFYRIFETPTSSGHGEKALSRSLSRLAGEGAYALLFWVLAMLPIFGMPFTWQSESHAVPIGALNFPQDVAYQETLTRRGFFTGEYHPSVKVIPVSVELDRSWLSSEVHAVLKLRVCNLYDGDVTVAIWAKYISSREEVFFEKTVSVSLERGACEQFSSRTVNVVSNIEQFQFGEFYISLGDDYRRVGAPPRVINTLS